MSFNKINSISKINDINDYNINKGKDYIIVFFYLNDCGACNMAIPIISKINEKNSNSNNCTIVKCHGPDIKDDKLNKIYGGKGFPTFKLLKKSNNGYKLFNFDSINSNIKFSTLGVVLSDSIKKDKDLNNILYYSTENTLKKWIYYSNKYPLSDKNSSANNILNNKTKKLMNYLNFIN
jgi:thiol-disulfide isomerase/thioredoxin